MEREKRPKKEACQESSFWEGIISDVSTPSTRKGSSLPKPRMNLVLGYQFILHSSLQVSEWVIVTRSCPILWDPMDCSLPGSSDHGIFQVKMLSGLPFPPPGDLPHPWIEPISVSCIPGRFFTTEPQGKEAPCAAQTIRVRVFTSHFQERFFELQWGACRRDPVWRWHVWVFWRIDTETRVYTWAGKVFSACSHPSPPPPLLLGQHETK